MSLNGLIRKRNEKLLLTSKFLLIILYYAQTFFALTPEVSHLSNQTVLTPNLTIKNQHKQKPN